MCAFIYALWWQVRVLPRHVWFFPLRLGSGPTHWGDPFSCLVANDLVGYGALLWRSGAHHICVGWKHVAAWVWSSGQLLPAEEAFSLATEVRGFVCADCLLKQKNSLVMLIVCDCYLLQCSCCTGPTNSSALCCDGWSWDPGWIRKCFRALPTKAWSAILPEQHKNRTRPMWVWQCSAGTGSKWAVSFAKLSSEKLMRQNYCLGARH